MTVEVWKHKKTGREVYILSFDECADIVEYKWMDANKPREKSSSKRIADFKKGFVKTTKTVNVY